MKKQEKEKEGKKEREGRGGRRGKGNPSNYRRRARLMGSPGMGKSEVKPRSSMPPMSCLPVTEMGMPSPRRVRLRLQ